MDHLTSGFRAVEHRALHDGAEGVREPVTVERERQGPEHLTVAHHAVSIPGASRLVVDVGARSCRGEGARRGPTDGMMLTMHSGELQVSDGGRVGMMAGRS
ncbi:hypothetical protein CXY01_09770 [Cellulomonas xylanilytica]|uniref:Uncharacterized protein n=1 Tax=Cellulomonas xylanilytica TaxID=233583 RepID=A0A510V0L9_9CELL|nr:hypothetical protein CXY01_09770 [Cellulomonas xylanilytica]